MIFTSTYFGIGIIEVLDDTQFLDSAILMNNPPAAFKAARPVGKGPLWFAAGVTLIDHNVSSPGRGRHKTPARRVYSGADTSERSGSASSGFSQFSLMEVSLPSGRRTADRRACKATEAIRLKPLTFC